MSTGTNMIVTMTALNAVNSDDSEEYCPKCDCVEDKITTCKKCGYVYPEEDYDFGISTPWWKITLWIIISLLLTYLLISFTVWAVEGYYPEYGYRKVFYSDKYTFLEFLGVHWEWIKDIVGKLW